MRILSLPPARSRVLLLASILLTSILLSIDAGPGRRGIEHYVSALTNHAAALATQHDVVLVTIDCLRADHVGAYGYKRPTTPYFDQLARQGVRFQRAYAQAPHTSFSIAALLTGRYFATLTRLIPEARFMTMARWFRAHGWLTAAVYPPAVYVTDKDQLSPYAADHFGFEHVRHEYLSADQSVDAAIDFFEKQRPSRALLWLHLFEPHEPYEVGGAPAFGSRDIDRYDQEIVVVDAALGRLARYLAQQRPGATLVVTSDHGEAFDEHNERFHGTNLYDEQLRVPLLIVQPSLRPKVVKAPVQLVDIFPTLIGLSHAPWPSTLDGHDLSGLMEGRTNKHTAVIATLREQLTLVQGNFKLIWDLRKDAMQLFNLAADPHELHDLTKERSQESLHLRAQLQDWIEEQLAGADRLRLIYAVPTVPAAVLRARLGDTAAADALAEVFDKSGSAATQIEAAQQLLRLPPRISTLSKLLQARPANSLIEDWIHVAELRLGHKPAQLQVERILHRASAAFELRLRAAQVLAFRAVRGTAPALLGLLDHCPTFDACREVIEALGQLGDRSTIPALTKRASDPMLQREVIRALGQISGAESQAFLVDCLLHDPRVSARIEAARALEKEGGAVALKALSQAATSDVEALVRTTAKSILASHTLAK